MARNRRTTFAFSVSLEQPADSARDRVEARYDRVLRLVVRRSQLAEFEEHRVRLLHALPSLFPCGQLVHNKLKVLVRSASCAIGMTFLQLRDEY
jgi:hypothetical protein